MCGIAGWVGVEPSPKGSEAVRAMTAALARRGPDSEGFAEWPGAALGHRRLAILDLSPAGHQPMLDADHRVGLVFNGCVYNFLELRAELEAIGRRFRSRCDTEVLLEGYLAWGLDRLVERLRGMYAFAIWDAREQRLSLVRDRMGVKPLLFSARGGQLAFASTASALAAAGWSDEIAPEGVLEFLEFGYLGERNCIYRDVRKVPPAGIVEWQDGKWSQRTYWDLPEPEAEGHSPNFEEAVAETERLLLESVKLRLEADVPIGALLSGGIDSSLVCWALRELGANVTAFTISTSGDPGDESAAAAQTARYLGIEHRIIPMPPEPEDLLGELTSAFGEPFGCSSALAMLRVSKAIKPHATVLLTGDGGDDVFLGYPYHRNYYLAQTWAHRLPSFAGPLWRTVRPLTSGLPFLRRPRHFLDYATGGLGAVTRVHDGLPYFEQRGLLGPRLRDLTLPQRQIPLCAASARRLVFDALAYERQMQFNGEFLTKVDGATMRYALEARSPFLDQKMWEFAARLPAQLRLAGGELKAILRALARQKLGAELANRPKQGFTIPVESWLVERWRRALQRLAADSHLEQSGWLTPGGLSLAVNEALEKRWAPQQLWHVLTLENWLSSQRGEIPAKTQR
ncbi:asparagine synthase (glutamine-hydrolyzing) [Nostoc sp. NIES-2111]